MRDKDVILFNGCTEGELKPDLFATWLSDPTADEAYAVILFYDDESKWGMADHYNRGRLLGMRRPTNRRGRSGPPVRLRPVPRLRRRPRRLRFSIHRAGVRYGGEGKREHRRQIL